MRFLKHEHLSSNQGDEIFKIAKMAKDRKAAGHHVFNATAGVLLNEDGSFYTHPSVYACYNRISDSQKASYALAVDGGEAFKTCLKDWVFRENEFLKKSEVVASAGGSGALSAVLNELVAEGDTIIYPDIYWGPYDLMLEHRKLRALYCPIFDDKGFTLVGIKKAMLELKATQKNIVVLINDPAHNPTGFSMSLEEWQDLISFSNSIATGDTTVSIINDIAYFDYVRDFANPRQYMQAFKDINDNVLIAFCFSGSKSLTAYGMRVGANLIYANQEEDRKNLYLALTKNARGTWSNVNAGALELITQLFSENNQDFQNDLQMASQLLKERFSIFQKEADDCGLAYYPAKEGFFVTLKGIEGRNRELFEKLKEKDIFVIPLPKGLRVAICSLSKEHCLKLPKLIQETIKEML